MFMPKTMTRTKVEREDFLTAITRASWKFSNTSLTFHATMAEVLGLYSTDYKALSLLKHMGPLSAGAIAKHTGLAMASVTNLIDRLEEKGFVRRIHDKVDRRRVLVEFIA